MDDLTPPKRFRISDPGQDRVFKRLSRLISGGAGAFFHDACRLAADDLDPFKTTTHLSAHALREAEASVRQVLEPLGGPDAEAPEEPAPEKCSPKQGHVTSIRKACRGLGLADEDPILVNWLRLASNNTDKFARWAHRPDLQPPRPNDDVFKRWLSRAVQVLDAVLERTEANYALVFKALEGLVAKTKPEASDIDLLKRKVPNTGLAHTFFFERLEQPEWLQPLAKSGVLVRVPPLDRNEDEGTIGFPRWPAQPYLLKMAKTGDRAIQEIVLQVLKTLPDTENTSVHADVAEIATCLPVDLAGELVEYIKSGLRKTYQLLLPHRVTPLIEYLAGAGRVTEATELAKALFEVLPDPAPPRKIAGMVYPPRPRARIQDVFYKHEMEKVVPALIAADPCLAVPTFADLLEPAVQYSVREDADDRHSHSHVWWPSIAGAGARLDEPRDYLLQALLDAVQACAEAHPESIRSLIETLEAHKWLVFTRVVLHLLTTLDEPPAEVADALAADKELLDEPETHVEHIELLRQRFVHLRSEQQKAIMEHLAAEPVFAEQKAQLEAWLGRDVTDDEVKQDIRRRKYIRLAPLAEVLPADLQTEFRSLTAEFQPEEAPPLPQPGWGERSPKSEDEMLSMKDEELLAYLKAAKFGHDRFGPSMEGLGDSLASAASKAPERFALLANQLQGADPSLISGFLRGLEAASKAKKELHWGPVLQLCRWVVDQPREIPERKTRYSDLDPGWAWTRRQIASMLLQGLQDQPGCIGFELREKLWPIIAVLLRDPDPEPSRTREDDPLTTALNSVRGEAVRAVMAYGLWVRRSMPDVKTFEQMPEVREALEAHLDSAIDASPAIRAVYGELMALLYYLDSGWLRAHLGSVFPADPADAVLRRGAWGGYVRYRPPLVPMLPELEPQYRRAIQDAQREDHDAKKPESAARKLAEHIMILAWQGNTGLDDPAGLVGTFFSEAPLALRSHALEFIGRSLMNTEGAVPQEALDRVMRLWGQRLENAKTTPIESVQEELEAYGWWFASRKFEPEWALAQMREVLELAGQVDWEHQVMETLAEMAETQPVRCVECLDLLMRRERETWSLDLSRDSVRKILELALKSGDSGAKKLAREVVNRLASWGLHGFRDLLE